MTKKKVQENQVKTSRSEGFSTISSGQKGNKDDCLKPMIFKGWHSQKGHMVSSQES